MEDKEILNAGEAREIAFKKQDENYLENDKVYKELATLLYLDKNLPNKKMKV